eukprot:scaffold1687_cov366-Pinguiococcus_pyrenoidosus.AAC.5
MAKRSRLTLQQEFETVQWWEEQAMTDHSEPTRPEVAAYIERSFGMKMSLPYVSALKKRKADVRERFLGASRHLKARKSCHKSPVEQLNNALDEWMNRMERQNAPVSDLVLTTKARQLGEGMQLPKSFKYSKMWLLNYKRSRGMTSKVLQDGMEGFHPYMDMKMALSRAVRCPEKRLRAAYEQMLIMLFFADDHSFAGDEEANELLHS